MTTPPVTPLDDALIGSGQATSQELRQQAALVGQLPQIQNLYDAVGEIVLILNKQRQIVFFNEAARGFFYQSLPDTLTGLRYGEAMGCRHAHESAAGCGAASHCAHCGALRAIIKARKGDQSTEEYRLAADEQGQSYEFRIRTRLLTLEDEHFTVLSLQDISHEKRRAILEKVFFHDILNTASGVKGLADLFELVDGEKQIIFRSKISIGANKLVDEINSQRLLTAAERNELRCAPTQVESLSFALDLLNLYESHNLAKNHQLSLDPSSSNVPLFTDAGLLSRVLGNMVKNALEANTQSSVVTLWCGPKDQGVRFSVHNPGVIPESVAPQIFHRSFTIKGAARGLGTYSMRLLGERYLGGQVSFVSSQEQGTVFFADFPLYCVQ